MDKTASKWQNKYMKLKPYQKRNKRPKRAWTLAGRLEHRRIKSKKK